MSYLYNGRNSPPATRNAGGVTAVPMGWPVVGGGLGGLPVRRSGFVLSPLAALIANLFGNGEQGGLWLPGPDTTVNGNGRLAAPGDTALIQLDLSRSLSETEYAPTTWTNASWNEFTDDGSGGFTAAKTVAGGTAVAYSEVLVPAALGDVFRFEVDVSTNTLSLFSVALSSTTNGRTSTISLANIGAGTYVGYSYANVATGTFSFQIATTQLGSITVTGVRAYKLAGNHATQASLASRPILARTTGEARRNLLTHTEQFDNAAWGKSAVAVIADATTAPDGTVSADLLYPVSTGNRRTLEHAFAYATDTTYSITVRAASAGKDWIFIGHGGSLFGSSTGVYFNVSSGTVGSLGTGFSNATITLGDAGFYTCSVVFDTTGLTPTKFGVGIVDANAGIGCTANGNDGVYLWGAQLEVAATASTYQRVGATAFDITEAGKPELWYLEFDGIDDFMVTSTITPGVDEAQVFAGVTKNNDAISVMAETSITALSNAGSFYFVSGADGSGNTYTALSRGSTGASSATRATHQTGWAPDTAVISAQFDISAPLVRIRRNGVNGNDATGIQGLGNFLAYPLYIGRRAGASLPFNGDMYGIAARFGANLDLTTIEGTEAFFATRAGVTLP